MQLGFIIGLIVFIGGTIMAFPHMQDDAYIHLRFAKNLFELHQFSYNPGQVCMGSSSVLYLLTIILFGQFIPLSGWPYIPKLLSVFFHLNLICIVLLLARNFLTRNTLLGLVLLTLCFSVPSACRWFQDGMETPFVVFLILASILSLKRYSEVVDHKPSDRLSLISTLVLTAIVRIDTVPICLGLAFLGYKLLPLRQWLQVFVPVVVSAIAWYGVLYILTGQIVPDTAIAKATDQFDPLWSFTALRTMGSVSPIWLIPVVLMMLKPRKYMIWLAVGLAPLLLILVGGTMRGQFIHGARYFLPSLAFLWGLFLVNWSADDDLKIGKKQVSATLSICLVFAAFGAIHFAMTAYPLYKLFNGTKLTIPAGKFTQGVLVGATDIGMIGWFSPVTILDFSGLVNGRKYAELKGEARNVALVTDMGFPQYLVLRGDNQPIELKNEAAVARTYAPSDTVVMRGEKLGQLLEWKLWTLMPEAK